MKVKKIEAFDVKYILNENIDNTKGNDLFTDEISKEVLRFHKTINGYCETELKSLKEFASHIGIKSFYVKDESTRFDLEAFKVLGGSYSVGKLICSKLGMDIKDVDFEYLKSDEVKAKLGDVTFATATDGNHGRGIAWAAKEFGQKAVIYMPKGTAQKRVDHIADLGATAIVTDLNYDDAVRLAFEDGKKNDWFVVQDTAWDGYTDIPTWIMQGYLTMATEACAQVEEIPTHVFLQAGVGAMAGAVQGYLANKYKENSPKVIVVEPLEAACVFRSAEVGDGKAQRVEGDLETIMAGLACGDTNPIGWEMLKDNAFAFLACDNFMAADGVRILGNPLGDDSAVVAGESGSVGAGLIYYMMTKDEFAPLRADFGLDKDSVVMIFNTEGATDPVNYREILWFGKYAK